MFALAATCSYRVVPVSNRVVVVFGGTAESAGTDVPVPTYVKCTVANRDGQTDYSEFATGAPVAVTARTTTPWLPSTVSVCAEGFAVFSPAAVAIVTSTRVCNIITS